MTRNVIAAFFVVGLSIPASAADTGLDGLRALGVDELRGGLVMDRAELLVHDYVFPLPDVSALNLANNTTLSFDVLFRSPDVDFFRWLGSPRPVVGVHLNLAGRESMAHAALNWRVEAPSKTETYTLFAEGELGVAAHNGYASNPPPGFRDTGSNVLVYLGYNLGIQLNERVSVMLSLQHGSHAGLAGTPRNSGINYMGLRFGNKL